MFFFYALTKNFFFSFTNFSIFKSSLYSLNLVCWWKCDHFCYIAYERNQIYLFCCCCKKLKIYNTSISLNSPIWFKFYVKYKYITYLLYIEDMFLNKFIHKLINFHELHVSFIIKNEYIGLIFTRLSCLFVFVAE